MTIFDRFDFEQRNYVILQLETLIATLKECTVRDHLNESSKGMMIGGRSTEDVEQKILNFALNYFGQSYSYEAREDNHE